MGKHMNSRDAEMSTQDDRGAASALLAASDVWDMTLPWLLEQQEMIPLSTLVTRMV